MKNKFIRFLSIVIIGFMFLACENPAGDTDSNSTNKNSSGNNSTSQQQNGGGSKDNSGGKQQGDSGKQSGGGTQQVDKDKQTDSDDTKTEQNKSEDEEKETQPEVKKNIGVKFNFEGAQALAKLEEKQNGSRAATNVDDLGDLVKIMADGSMENAITVGENCSLSDIVAIYKSPLETSNDVFIVFNSESTIGYEEVEKEYDWGEKYIDKQEIRVGQLICLHEDGSIADILRKENSTGQGYSHVSLKTESVTFDTAGNVYFISSDNGDMIYQYNPATDELTKMVAAVENTYYEKMQIDDEGQWIFVSGSRNSSYFLRAIPINNPNGFVNIFYSSNEQIGTDKWSYDNKNGKMYFIVNDGNKTGLFSATKSGGFRDKTFIHSSVGDGFENDLFECIQVYTASKDKNWTSSFKTNGVFDAAKTVQKILDALPSRYDHETKEYKKITIDDIDIRFDKYHSSTDCLKAIAVLTAGKKNEEAFKALDNSLGKIFLYEMYGKNEDGKNWFEYVSGEGYYNNFLADILYVKDTDTLLVDSDEVIYTYYDYAYNEDYSYTYDENGNIKFEMKSIKGSDCIQKNENGFYSDWGRFEYITQGSDYGSNIITYAFSPKYYNSDGTINSAAILNYFYSFCNVKGTKEFTLNAYKDDAIYGSIYTNLKNEEAIEWINSNVERLNLFGQLLGIKEGYDSTTEKSIIQLYYSPFMNFLSKTCFIAGTNQKAVTWNWDYEINESSIPYSYYLWASEKGKLTSTDTGVYYEYYNTSGTDPYYYIVQVADSDGKLVELINKLPLPAGKVVKSEKNNDRILLQYSVMDDNGAELGYHHIYSVEMATGKVTNCFDNVPNRNNLEVVSFNSAGDLLYYSAVRGTSVENGIVNIVTNEYNPLTVQRKMVAVYTFN